VLHLHGLNDGNALTCGDALAVGDVDDRDGARHGRGDRAAVGGVRGRGDVGGLLLADGPGAPVAPDPQGGAVLGDGVGAGTAGEGDRDPIACAARGQRGRLPVADDDLGGDRPAADLDRDGLVDGEPERGPGGSADPPGARDLERVDDRTGRFEGQQAVRGGRGEHVVGDGGGDPVVDLAADEPGVEPACDDVGISEHRTQEADVGAEPEQHGLRQGDVQAAQRLGAVAAVRDDLGEHGVVVAADGAARCDARVDAHPCGQVEGEDSAAGGQEPGGRVLGVDAGLDRVAARFELGGPRRHLAGRDAQLQLDEVDPVDLLGDRVLDLQPGVHLHEEELVGAIGADDELDRAGAGVADGLRRLDRGRAHGRPLLRGEQRRRRLLDDLLVAPLQRALALAEVHGVAVGVGQHLDLDVPRAGDQPLDEQRVIAERAPRLAASGGDGSLEVLGPVHLVHALAAAARAGLEQHRVADLSDGRDQLGVGEPGAVGAGDDRHAGLGDGLLGADLVAHGLDGRGGRTDERDPRGGARCGERGVLGEEAVSGVDRLGAGGAGSVEHVVDREVAADADGDVGGDDVRRARVGVGVDGDAADTEPAQRAQHAHGDLPAVGDEHGGEHQHPPRGR